MIRPNNRFTAGGESNVITTDFERETYLLKYTKKDSIGEVIGYIDIYTGRGIGSYYNGD